MNVKKFYMSFIAKLRDDRKLEILVYSALILTAVIIFLSTGGISCGSTGYEGGKEARSSASSGATELETRLETVLSSIEGAGRVNVMIAMTDPGRSAEGAFSSSAERSASRNASNVSGVIVVAQGASDIGVMLRLQTAVATLLRLDPGCVSVFPMDN